MPAKDVRVDIRKVYDTEDGALVIGWKWVLQSTQPVEDLWESPESLVFDNELCALHHFMESSKKAGYMNLTFTTDPTGE